MEEDFTKKSDDELVAIIAVPPNHAAHRAAAAELHRRQKQYEDKNILLQNRNVLLQKWILRATILAVSIAGITLAFVVVQFFQHSDKIASKHEKTHINGAQNQPKDQLGPGKALEFLKEDGKDAKHK